MRSGIGFRGVASATVVASLVAWSLIIASRASAEETPANTAPGKKAPAPPKLPEPKGARRLFEDHPIWIDPQEKTIIVEGQIALREGMLEMFACTRNTKEHESIVS